MKTIDKLLAEKLLRISAVKLQPESPFVWASGWNSPIYTDIRRALSYPDVRTFINIELSRTIIERFPEADAVAAVANGAIAFGAMVSDAINLPYAYVRDTPKDHGLENTIEGNLKMGWKVVIIEDQLSTGRSSIAAVEAVRNAGCEPLGIITVLDFEFPISARRFNDQHIPVISLLTYSKMIQVAQEQRYIEASDLDTLHQWREDPAGWVPSQFRPL